MRRWMVAAVAVALTAAGCSDSGDGADADKAAQVVESATAAVDARDYVAMGDSYAAGVGAGNYLDKTCMQSKDKSYPALWAKARATGVLAEVTNSTCGGATVSTVLGSQLSALDAETGWVTLTVGGNDAGWSTTLRECMVGTGNDCAASVKTATDGVQEALPKSLDSLYSVVRDRAPNAKVYVPGYPHLVAEPGKGVSCQSLTDAHRKALNSGADILNKVIADTVAKHEGFTFVDVREAFKGHEACTATPWINSVRDKEISESFHPNAAGYVAYTKALTAVTG